MNSDWINKFKGLSWATKKALILFFVIFVGIFIYILPGDKFELRQILRVFSVIISITSFVFFFVYFINILFIRNLTGRERVRDVDYKILATFGLLALIPPFLPELSSKISEIGNVKIRQLDKANFRDQFQYTKEFNSVRNPTKVKDGSFEALTFFLPIMMALIIEDGGEERSKEKINLLCEALWVTGVPSSKQVLFYEQSRSSLFTENTYLYFGLPMGEKEASKDFKRENFDDFERFKTKRKALEKIVGTKCEGKKIFSKKGLIQKLSRCIKILGEANSSVKKKRRALNELISAFKKNNDTLENIPSYFPTIAQFYTQLAKTYDVDSADSPMEKAQEYYEKATPEIPKPDRHYAKFLYADFIAFDKGQKLEAIEYLIDAWHLAEKKASPIKSSLEKVDGDIPIKDPEIEVIINTKKILLNQIEKNIITAKNRAIYYAAIEGDLKALKEGYIYDFIIKTFENHKNDPAFLDTKALALIVYSFDQKCSDKMKTIQVAKEALMSASIIAKRTNKENSFNHVSEKLAFLASTDFGC